MPETAISAVAKKLLLKPGFRLALVNPPAGYESQIEPLPAGTVQAPEGEDGGNLDAVQLFAGDSAELDRLAPAAISRLRPGGLLWICYRKGGAKAGTDLNRDLLWQHMSQYGLVGVSLIAVDGTWSAMRFRREGEGSK